MKIVGLCGRAGAGKGSIVSVTKECFPNVQVISTGDATRRILASRGIAPTHENLQNITKQILAERSCDYISFVFDLISPRSSVVLIDSFRRVEDVACVTKYFGAPTVILISAPDELRFQRLKYRARVADAVDEASFKDLTALEDSWGIEHLFRIATLEITNTGTLRELRQAALKIFGTVFL